MNRPAPKRRIARLMSGIVIGLLPFAAPAWAVSVNASYLYTLSDFTGSVRYNGGKIFVDQDRNESYILYQNVIRVYNNAGIEIYRFGDNADYGMVRDLAVEQDGTILLLAYDQIGESYSVIRCNFRGDIQAKVTVSGLPSGFKEFQPNYIAERSGKIYLVDYRRQLVALVDRDGKVIDNLDLFKLLHLDEKDRENAEMDGFNLDRDGSLLFTMPTMFRAYRVSLDRTVSSFGRPGSIPGTFGVVSGIAADNRGNYLVADKLKCVVSVFDPQFHFLYEFGHRGTDPMGLTAPNQLAIDGSNKIYIVQPGSKGVSVFRLYYN